MELGAALNYFDTDDKQCYKNQNVMLSFFDVKNLYRFYEHDSEHAFDWLKENNINVISVHIPNQCALPGLIKLACGLINKNIKDKLIIMHPPNKHYPLSNVELQIINDDLEINNAYLCWENFSWHRKKWLRSPFEIAELCSKWSRFKMTFDTSHIDDNDYWLRLETMQFLSKYIKVIHLSNRVLEYKHQRKISEINKYEGSDDYGQHLPPTKGELKLESFIKTIKKQLSWDGQIIIEMMPCYDKVIDEQIKIVSKWINSDAICHT